MKAELRSNKNGSTYFSFVYYDRISKKPKRISKADIRKRFGKDITDYEESVKICKILGSESDTLRHRIEKRLRWESSHYQFDSLVDFYELEQKKKAPNSFVNNVHYLKYYVLPFFLSIKKCTNISLWYDFYPEFKDWLEDKARLIMRPEELISYASKNHAIKALNTFMHMLFRSRILDKYFRCECFPAHKLNERGIEGIIKIEEMEQVYSQLRRDGHEKEALFFRFLYFTGMRFNEAMGIHPGNLYDGHIEDRILMKHLNQEAIEYFGYVVFDNQPAHERGGIRDKNGIVHRKPLKGKHKINDRAARTVVIVDKLLWNELTKQHNFVLQKYEQGLFGDEIDQYPIFEGINKSTSTTRLKDAYKKCGLLYRNWHCCRHTRATMLIGQTGNTLLARLWLGHSSEKILNRYVHIYEAVIRSAKKLQSDGTRQIRMLNTVK